MRTKVAKTKLNWVPLNQPVSIDGMTGWSVRVFDLILSALELIAVFQVGNNNHEKIEFMNEFPKVKVVN